jgi:hypothetical protein
MLCTLACDLNEATHMQKVTPSFYVFAKEQNLINVILENWLKLPLQRKCNLAPKKHWMKTFNPFLSIVNNCMENENVGN